MADDSLKSLGIKRRERPSSEPRRGGSKDDEGGEGGEEKKSALSGMGFKRRSGPAAEEEPAKESKSKPARGRGRGKKDAEPEDTEAMDLATAKAIANPPDYMEGKLGNVDDDTALMLRNYFRARPELPPLIPARAWELHCTNGRYIGDGQVARDLKIGWRPAMVMYSAPVYPDGQPEFSKEWKVIDPGVHKQPEFTDLGWIVPPHLNVKGDWYFYFVFKSDGEPLDIAPPPETDARKKKKKKKGSGPGLGIKRRK